MKIFSNFDTRYADFLYTENLQQYKPEQILLLRRSKYYLFFHIAPAFVMYCVAFILGVISTYVFIGFIGVSIFILFWLLLFWFQIVYKFLKYICDFTIITPSGITTYKQKGILHSVLKEIPANKVKAVEIFRAKLLGNIFGYGNVDIIADMNDSNYINVDNEAPWVVGLSYVDAPHRVKSKISQICFR